MPQTKTSPFAVLRRTALFADLAEDELSYIAKRMVPHHFRAGKLIFSEGDSCAGLWVIESGKVRIFTSSASGREQVLAVDGPGSTVAELPVFDEGRYPASAAAVNDSTLLFVSKQDFQSFCLEHPKVMLKVLRVVGRRLRRLVGIIEELSFTTVRHRLASLLLGLAQEGRRTPDGIEVTLLASQEELAAEIGTVRELVSRNLSRLHAQGTILIEGRKLIIADLKALEAESEKPE